GARRTGAFRTLHRVDAGVHRTVGGCRRAAGDRAGAWCVAAITNPARAGGERGNAAMGGRDHRTRTSPAWHPRDIEPASVTVMARVVHFPAPMTVVLYKRRLICYA